MKTIKKLILFLILICAFVFICSTSMIKETYKNVLFENTYEAALGSLRQMEFNIEEKREAVADTIMSLLSGNALNDLVYTENASSIYAYEEINQFNQEVMEALNLSEDIASILYLNQDGFLIGTDGQTVWRETANSRLRYRVREMLPEGSTLLTTNFFVTEGFSSDYFYVNKPYIKKEKECYITTFVPCKFSQTPKREGVLMVNIKEEAFNDIFSVTMEKNDGDVYILNDEGMILSSTKPELLQTRYLLQDDIKLDEKEHFFTADDVYAISYEMASTKWRIVWERPVEAFYGEANHLYQILVCYIFASLLLVVICYSIYTKTLLKPLSALTAAMKDVGEGQYGISVQEKSEGEIGQVIQSFNEMSQNIEALTKENMRVNNDKRALQLLALQEQMSPHFVLNALNTIKWMATIAKEKNIVNMVISLSRIIYAFKNTSAFGTIGEEIDFVKNYIIVMNYRYGDVISVHYEVEEKLLNVSIPIFFIQPLVENALKHGFESTNCQGNIHIKVWEEDDNIYIRVKDDGSGLTAEKKEELSAMFAQAAQRNFNEIGGIGLMNIAKRIQLYYGGEYGIRIEDTQEKGTQFLITLPYEYDQK